MDELLRTSLLWRLFAALAALYHRTFLPRMFAAIHRAFAESLPGRALRRLLGGQPAVERSAYRRLMDRGNAWLCGIGARVVPVLEDSLAYRIYRRVMAALRNSLLLGWLFAGGMTGFLLFLFSSYAIVDYLLRDVLQLAAIAAVWDELLMLFSLYNIGLFAAVTAISFAVFAALYAVVYRQTAGAYYAIVSGGRDE